MSSEAEYDGLSVVSGDATSCSGIPAAADRVLLYHLLDQGEIAGGTFKNTLTSTGRR